MDRSAQERQGTASFWDEFLGVWGIDRKQVARFEEVARRYSTGGIGFIDMFWPGRLLVEQKTAAPGASGTAADDAAWDALAATMPGQAKDYLPGMVEMDVPRLLVVSDFQRWIVEDLTAGVRRRFRLAELSDNLDLFGFLVGRTGTGPPGTRRPSTSRPPTCSRPSETSCGGPGMTTTSAASFSADCLFADDAQVWPLGLFEDYLLLRTREDGSDLGSALELLFQVLNTAREQRSPNLPEELVDFTYINGGLFQDRLATTAKRGPWASTSCRRSPRVSMPTSTTATSSRRPPTELSMHRSRLRGSDHADSGGGGTDDGIRWVRAVRAGSRLHVGAVRQQGRPYPVGRPDRVST